MLKIIEVVGTSEKSFSDAVKSAVDKIAESGDAAHFFQIVEQRGSIRDKKLREFQVIMKVAVEDNI